MRKTLNFLSPTFILAISALLSSLLGVFRDHLLAKTFGATSGTGIYNLDAYYAAFKIPDFFFFILVTGSISAAFIPIFTRYKKEDKFKEAWEFASNMLHLMLVIIFFLTLLAFIFAPQLAKLVASGFEPEAFDLTVSLMRIMLLSPILLTLSSVLIVLQDSFKTFIFRSLVPIFYNLAIIGAIVWFAPQFGVMGVTWGVIVGTVVSVLIQLPALKLIGYKHIWILNAKKSDIQEVFKLMVPRVLTMTMSQLSQIVFTLMASFLALGSVTILYFANNLYSLPLSMIAVSFSITTFATLSELALEKGKKPFALEIKRIMHQILFLVFPATVGMILLRSEIIGTILLAGKFTMQDAVLTSNVLFFMLLALFTHSLILLLNRGFYAQHDTKTPLYASLWGALLGLLFAFVFTFVLEYGLIGVGIGMAISNIFTFLFLYFPMKRNMRHAILDFRDLLKMLLASFAMGATVYFLKTFFAFPNLIWMKLIYLILMAMAGSVVYFGLAYLLKIPERKMIFKSKRRA